MVERECVLVCREYTLKYRGAGGGHQMVPKKVLCTLFATFHKLEMIQEKIKSKRFISAVAKAVTLSLSH